MSALPSPWAGARVAAQGGQVASASVLAGRAVAHVGHRRLAQRVLESDRAGALEAGSLSWKLDNCAGAAILALLIPSAARVRVLAVFPNITRRTPEKKNVSKKAN